MMSKWMMSAALVLLLSGCGPAPEATGEAARAPADGGPEPAMQASEAVPGPEQPEELAEDMAMTEQDDVLTGTGWWVEDIGGAGVVDSSRSTVEFFEPGRVAGNSGCNRYTGGYERDGEALKFGMLAGTMMACPEALMNQEQRFHEAMGQVVSWRIDAETDLLHLLDTAGDTVIRASRLPEDATDS